MDTVAELDLLEDTQRRKHSLQTHKQEGIPKRGQEAEATVQESPRDKKEARDGGCKEPGGRPGGK